MLKYLFFNKLQGVGKINEIFDCLVCFFPFHPVTKQLNLKNGHALTIEP